MDTDVLDDIAFSIDRAALRRGLHLPEGGPDADTVARFADQAERLGRHGLLLRGALDVQPRRIRDPHCGNFS